MRRFVLCLVARHRRSASPRRAAMRRAADDARVPERSTVGVLDVEPTRGRRRVSLSAARDRPGGGAARRASSMFRLIRRANAERRELAREALKVCPAHAHGRRCRRCVCWLALARARAWRIRRYARGRSRRVGAGAHGADAYDGARAAARRDVARRAARARRARRVGRRRVPAQRLVGDPRCGHDRSRRRSRRTSSATTARVALAAGRLAPAHVGQLVDGYRTALDDRSHTGVRGCCVDARCRRRARDRRRARSRGDRRRAALADGGIRSRSTPRSPCDLGVGTGAATTTALELGGSRRYESQTRARGCRARDGRGDRARCSPASRSSMPRSIATARGGRCAAICAPAPVASGRCSARCIESSGSRTTAACRSGIARARDSSTAASAADRSAPSTPEGWLELGVRETAGTRRAGHDRRRRTDEPTDPGGRVGSRVACTTAQAPPRCASRGRSGCSARSRRRGSDQFDPDGAGCSLERDRVVRRDQRVTSHRHGVNPDDSARACEIALSRRRLRRLRAQRYGLMNHREEVWRHASCS